MNSTSSQDQFAKWAKIRRSHDKVQAEYEQKSMFIHFYTLLTLRWQKLISTPSTFPATNLKDFKSTFDRTITFLRWGGTNGLRFFLQFWYAKNPLFWIPRGWVPGYVEWLLAFPRAPTGSVSIQMWGVACATAVQLVGAAVVAGMVLGGESEKRGGKVGMEVMAGERGGKKEL